jgi:antitoxin component YwqK of YwqJK toxin-antitoxin module
MKKIITAFLICITLTGCASTRVHLDQIEDRVGPNGLFLAYRKGAMQPFTGKAFDRHPDGKMKEQRTYRAGRETGPYRTWYPNGQKEEDVYKVNGVANGRWHEWHDNGQWEIRGTAKDGRAIGRFRTWDADGTVTEDRVYPEGGIPVPSATEEEKQNPLLHRTQ